MDKLPVVPSEPGAAEVPVVCRLLRTKHSFGAFDGGGAPWQAGLSTTAVHWCLATMETAGPDDGFAHALRCRAGRRCFEAPAEMPRADA
ncbi:MAG TPA: hypothetical protein VHF22_06880 [Planctomycetota bacterium]|nr:hypothetical protein [Planctomycetota bacterium]